MSLKIVAPGAAAKSRELLLEWLSEEQRATFELWGTFRVKGSHTGNTYVINAYMPNYNVRDVKNEIEYCFQPSSPCLPFSDIVLAQKINLENDEPSVLRVANPRRPPNWRPPQ